MTYLDDYDASDPRQVVITFDGIYEDVATYAAPLLAARGLPFECFVIGDYIGRDNSFDSPEPLTRFASMSDLDDIVQLGGRIQWHTRTHARLDGHTEDLAHELDVPNTLRARFPSPHLRWIAYPHGSATGDLRALVAERFAGGLACDGGSDSDRFNLTRKSAFFDTVIEAPTTACIIVNYNYGRFVDRAVRSVLEQTSNPDELWIVDDASTDGSQSSITKYASRAEVVLQPKNLGIRETFHRAVERTRADYVMFLGADNWLRQDAISVLRRRLDANPAACAAYFDMILFGERAGLLAHKVGASCIGEPKMGEGAVYHWMFPDPTAAVIANLGVSNVVNGSSMFRRVAFNQVGGYRGQVEERPEDHDLFLRMVRLGWKLEHVSEPLLYYRQHSPDQANSALAARAEVVALRAELARRGQAFDEKQLELMRALEALAENQAEVERQQSQLATAREAQLAGQEQLEVLSYERDQLASILDSVYASKAWRFAEGLRRVMRGEKRAE